MSAAPYLSLVLVTRNDGHGGDMLARLRASLDNTLWLLERHALPGELVLLEWNPPAGAPLLRDVLAWPARPDWCSVRSLVVDAATHAGYADAHLSPIHVVAGVNAGIRRARGAFVLPTTMDHLYGEDVIAFIANKGLETRTLYRINRCDVPREATAIADRAARLAWSADHVTRVNARAERHHDETYPMLHTNACGDFQLLDRASWHALRGYREEDFVGYHCDSLLAFAAYRAGIREVVLEDMRVFHIEHDGGFAGKLHVTIGGDGTTQHVYAGKPVPSWPEVELFIRDVVAGRRPYVFNDEGWGCGARAIPEVTVARAAWDEAASSQP